MHYLIIYILILKLFQLNLFIKIRIMNIFLYISNIYLFRIYLLLLNERNNIIKYYILYHMKY